MLMASISIFCRKRTTGASSTSVETSAVSAAGAVSSAGLPVQQGFSHSGYLVVFSSGTLSCPGTACGTTWSDNVYKTMVTVSAPGVLHFLAIQMQAALSGAQSIRLTIDGGTPVEFTQSAGDDDAIVAVGTLHTDGSWALQPLRFTASLLVEIKANVSSGSPVDNWCNYHCLYTLD